MPGQEKKSPQHPDPVEIHPAELLGRRAFGKCIAGENGRVPAGYFQLDVFYERRPGVHLSMDRLGVGSAPNRVKLALKPCYEHQEKARGMEFVCWAAIQRKQIAKESVFPSPIPAGGEEPGNPYHCELDMAVYTDERTRESLAFKLSMLAKKVDP